MSEHESAYIVVAARGVRANSASAAAERIGYPVVLKPFDGNHGRGVCLNRGTEGDVRAAFPIAGESRNGSVLV